MFTKWWVSRELFDAALADADYFRKAFERERDRADRAVDELIQATGRMPISAHAQAVQEQENEVAKMLADVDFDMNDIMPPLEPEPEKEAT